MTPLSLWRPSTEQLVCFRISPVLCWARRSCCMYAFEEQIWFFSKFEHQKAASSQSQSSAGFEGAQQILFQQQGAIVDSVIIIHSNNETIYIKMHILKIINIMLLLSNGQNFKKQFIDQIGKIFVSFRFVSCVINKII